MLRLVATVMFLLVSSRGMIAPGVMAADFCIRDANGQALAFVNREDEPGRRATAKLLTREEAQPIAANIPKLPHLSR